RCTRLAPAPLAHHHGLSRSGARGGAEPDPGAGVELVGLRRHRQTGRQPPEDDPPAPPAPPRPDPRDRPHAQGVPELEELRLSLYLGPLGGLGILLPSLGYSPADNFGSP